jgi:hypothetical protein
MDDHNKIVVNEISKLLLGGSAHIGLKDALDGLPKNLRSIKPDNMPYSIWQLVEHIRIAQWDMLQFCKDDGHQSPKWPDDYWPKEGGPQHDDAWSESLEQINNDLDEFIALVEHSDLYQKIPGGDGQNILLEALQMADHSAYHIGEIVAIRRMLNAWK